RLAICNPTSVAATVPRIPSAITTPTTIRNVFRPLLVLGVLATGAADGVVGLEETGSVTFAPHLVQKEAPESKVAPQELQKATGHPLSRVSRPIMAEYIAT